MTEQDRIEALREELPRRERIQRLLEELRRHVDEAKVAR
jgi:hypothetical protein